jgi:murein DD-endopeptidase MepM/ murein hydrolase activator NlpD
LRLVGAIVGAAVLAAAAPIEWPLLSPASDWAEGPARLVVVPPAIDAAVGPLRSSRAPAIGAVPLAAPAASLPPADVVLDSDAPPVSPAPAETVEARPGDTPLKLLTRAGVTPQEARAAIRTLSTVWDPRDLRAGQKAAVFVQDDRLLSIRLALAPDREVVVARDDRGNFVAEDQDRPTREIATLGTGTIHTSLSAAANRAGVPAGVLAEMIAAFSFDVDFQREIQPGDTFTLLYQRVHDEFGKPTDMGRLVYAELVLSGSRLRLYRFTPQGGEPGFFTALGENIKKPLLRTPIDGARLSSGFGMRHHPILGYSRMHRGVDFAAPSGTAVYAAGDGVVVRAGRVSGYGNYVEIEHNPQYTTAYGHLSAFAHGLHDGERVRQGEVIGYVGMTGLATGPHLHYEVHDHGGQVDPLSIKMPALTRLAGAYLKAFEATRYAVERELIELRQDLVAHLQCRGGAC